MINIAFCFIVKDGGKYLHRNLQSIINLALLFCDEYKIFYVENDSNDNTREILENFKLKNIFIYTLNIYSLKRKNNTSNNSL